MSEFRAIEDILKAKARINMALSLNQTVRVVRRRITIPNRRAS